MRLWSQIMTGDSNHLFIEAMAPGNDIFDETGEIRVVWRAQGAEEKKVPFVCQIPATSTIRLESRRRPP